MPSKAGLITISEIVSLISCTWLRTSSLLPPRLEPFLVGEQNRVFEFVFYETHWSDDQFLFPVEVAGVFFCHGNLLKYKIPSMLYLFRLR